MLLSNSRSNADGSLTALNTVSAVTTTYTHGGLTPGVIYNYIVRAIDASGNTDGNSGILSSLTYEGVTSATVSSTSSALIGFPSANQASAIRVYCAAGSGSFSLIASLSGSSTSYLSTGLSSGTTYTCKTKAVSPSGEDSNTATVTFTPPNLNFAGATAAQLINASQVQITWSAGSGSSITNYKIYEIASDGVTKTALSTVASSTLSYTINSPSQAIHTYQVKALSASGLEDSNTIVVSAYPYAGITSVSSVGVSSMTANFPTAPGMTYIDIFCKSLGGSYPGSPNARVSASATSASVTGLASGRTYTCVAQPNFNNVSYTNAATSGFQTTSNSSTKYNGVILVSAYGAAATAPSGPTSTQVNLTFKYFGTSSTASQSYSLVRVGKGGTIDMTTSTACTSGITTSCKVTCFQGASALTSVVGSSTCTDNNVAASPQQYDYAITLISSDGTAEELPVSGDTGYRITVAIPPANMVLVHRDSANYEHCQLMSRTSDPLNHQRCPIVGASMLGAIPYNTNPGGNPLNLSTGYYDFGYNLFVDRWVAACNWTLQGSGAPAGGTGSNGDVYYNADSGDCYVKSSGSWTTMNGQSGTNLALGYTISPSSTSRRPPIVNISQTQSYATCQAVVDPNYGAKRLLRHREYIAAAAWPTLTGEPGAMSDSTITAMESPAAGNHAGGTYACNSDTHNGIANATFNSASYELARNTAAGPDSFVIGSTGTKNCLSRFGLQDHVANVWHWTSDQMGSCNAVTHTCNGIQSALDGGNGYSSGFDMNGFLFNGTQGPGGSVTINGWSLTGLNYSANNFNFALGLPLVGTDNGNAISISSYSAKFHSDYFDLYTDNGASRGLLVGGFWSYGANAGRWYSNWGNAPSYTYGGFGFRCSLPAE